MPQYVQSLFNTRENKKNLRGKNKFVLPEAKTMHDLWPEIDLLRCC